MSDALCETVLQFGGGKFLRCFADLFVHEVNVARGGHDGVVVVQSTGVERAAAINRQGGRFHAVIRGQRAGKIIDAAIEVRSLSRAVAAAEDWPAVLAVARSAELRLIVSNTTEAGYRLEPDDDAANHAPPRSFPAKLLAALRARYEAGQPGPTILPCELYDRNADRLRDLVLQQAARWELPSAVVDWLQTACTWRNTLVDRIVAAASGDDQRWAGDALAAVAEPFALWLVEGAEEVPVVGAHPAVQCVAQLEPYALRKVRILNGAHTALVAQALPRGLLTVRAAIGDAEVGPWLRGLLFEEIVPVLEGRVPAPAEFAAEVLERFGNPFLEHRLADIALHHDVKLKTRLLPSYEDFRARFGREPLRLGQLLRQSCPGIP